MKTGFVGLGAMGRGMARNLHAAGLLEGVWNRTRVTADDFAKETPAFVAADAAELAARCDALVLCVSADEDVLTVMEAMKPALRPDALVIDCSTVSAETAQAAAEQASGAGARFLDAPVSGGTEGAEQGSLTIMVGGEEADFRRARPVLDAMGGRVAHMGPVGAGQATKAVNQVMVAGINQAVGEAMAFAKTLNLPLEDVIEVVGSGAAGNWFVNHRGVNMISGEYPPGFKVRLHHKDLNICRRMAERRDGRLPLTDETLSDYESLMEQGWGDDDISALYRLKAALFD
jgi:3-hydroxyisobutyrate dehydrogenase